MYPLSKTITNISDSFKNYFDGRLTFVVVKHDDVDVEVKNLQEDVEGYYPAWLYHEDTCNPDDFPLVDHFKIIDFDNFKPLYLFDNVGTGAMICVVSEKYLDRLVNFLAHHITDEFSYVCDEELRECIRDQRQVFIHTTIHE